MSLTVPVLVVYLVVSVSCVPASADDKGEIDTTTKTIRYCQPQTPCAWKIFNHVDYTEINLSNSYCICKANQRCQFHESRPSEGFIEMRCKLVVT